MPEQRVKLVIIETPFAAEDIRKQSENIAYARLCCRDACARGERPFASHLFFPQFLNDDNPEERKIGLEMGYAFWDMADYVVFYIDRGVSAGMQSALTHAFLHEKPFQKRLLYGVQKRVASEEPPAEEPPVEPGPEAYAPKPTERTLTADEMVAQMAEHVKAQVK